jgi:hypothetical protein
VDVELFTYSAAGGGAIHSGQAFRTAAPRATSIAATDTSVFFDAEDIAKPRITSGGMRRTREANTVRGNGDSLGLAPNYLRGLLVIPCGRHLQRCRSHYQCRYAEDADLGLPPTTIVYLCHRSVPLFSGSFHFSTFGFGP